MRLLMTLVLATTALTWAEPVNKPAPELDIRMESGQTMKLSQLKGKPVMLVFFSTTCPHCQKSAAAVEQTLRKYSARGLQVIAVTSDERQRAEFPEFRKKYGATYPMGSIGSQESYRFFGLSVMRPFYVPTFAFIDRAGVLREQFIGGLLQNNPNATTAVEQAEMAKHIDALLIAKK